MASEENDPSCPTSSVKTGWTRFWTWGTSASLVVITILLVFVGIQAGDVPAYSATQSVWNGSRKDMLAGAWTLLAICLVVGNIWNTLNDNEEKTGWTRFWMCSASAMVLVAVVFALVLAKSGLRVPPTQLGPLLVTGVGSMFFAIGSISNASC